MLKQISHRVLAKRHFWRYASFTELNELYVSNMLRAVAGSLFGIFVPVYMLGSGYSIIAICMYFVLYFVMRAVADILTAHIVAYIGPKHAWILSHLSSIAALICLLGIGSTPWLFWLSAIFNAWCASLMWIPLHVDFSKIKDVEHNGKEQGFMMILQKVGGAVGPMLGGYIAATYGPQLTIIVSIIIYTLSLIPILSTPEQVQTRQKIQFKGFPYKKVWRDIVSHAAQSTDATVSNSMWPLFLTLAVFTSTAGYEEIGFASTISLIAAIVITYMYGRVLDGKHPLVLLRISTVANSLVYIARITVKNILGVVATNIGNEAAFTGQWMATNKGMYVSVDDLPGHRIAYFTILQATGELVKCLVWVLLAVLTLFVSTVSAIQICFAVTGLLALLVLVERYAALRPRVSRRLLQ